MKNNSPGEKINPLNTHILLEKKKKKSYDKREKNLPLFLCFGFTRRKKRKNYHTKCLVLHVFTHDKRKFERMKKYFSCMKKMFP